MIHQLKTEAQYFDDVTSGRITKPPNADTRTATKPIDKETLLQSSLEHISHVSAGLEFFSELLNEAANKHDWTKVTYIDEFARDAATGSFGEDFKKLPWFRLHVTTERHHVKDCCPEDVNLLDLLERVADITMAGLSRSGEIYSDEIPVEILQRAYKNTIVLLKKNVVVEESEATP
jgi:hypothetical protein